MNDEQRIKSLEDFQKRWKFYFWAVIIISGIFSTFFGWKLIDTWKSLNRMTTEVDVLDSRLEEMTKKAEDAVAAADRAYIKAGDLEFAVNEAKKASLIATNLSVDIKSASEQATKSSELAAQYSKEAKAIAQVVESRLRSAEIILTELKAEKKTNSVVVRLR